MLDLEDEGTTILQNMGPTHTTAHHYIPEDMKLKVTLLEIILLQYSVMGRVLSYAIQK
jgi:hypothetical protein